ncbi:MAG: glycoside hydrolase family 127 protein, partial [Bacteroidota bacterium]|nr:glycoside hydrolase family 127 protein [Bacteroidota bacterium]
MLTLSLLNKTTAQPSINNRAPLKVKPYMELSLGSIKPMGWLRQMLISQKNGATGHLDKLYPLVMGPRNGWLGGDGDQWERGPYWIDGLLPLAYILDDDDLKAKVQPWIEWTIKSQRVDGYFGPSLDYEYEKGIQRNNSQDWWPKIVMLKILQQYHSATGDKRVIKLMDSYFQYQLKTLPGQPLGYWTFWAEYRSADNLQAVYWLYNITGEKYLLDLGELLHKQGYDFTDMFLNRDDLSRINTIHGVNLAQGIKEPIIYYQKQPDLKYIIAVKKGLADIRKYNGQPQGMYGADEALHGKNPTQGSELCSAVELMYSLEKMLEITGDLQFADHLERIAFNALPTQISDDFMVRQYFQQPNQVKITRDMHNFDINHGETDIVFGLLTGYPCCTSNMHQGWPKFTQNLWYATHDNGIAALVYSPSEVKAKVADGIEIRIIEETNYPFDEKIKFTIHIENKSKTGNFPFHLKIPSWTKNASIFINGKSWNAA